MQARQYDPKTKTWKVVGISEGTPVSPTKNNSSNNGSNLTSTNTNNNTSVGAVEQEYNNIEINTLEGTVSVVPTPGSLEVEVGDVVRLEGFGNTLTGCYYVKEVVKQINASGITLTWTVTRSDFGSSLKLSNM